VPKEVEPEDAPVEGAAVVKDVARVLLAAELTVGNTRETGLLDAELYDESAEVAEVEAVAEAATLDPTLLAPVADAWPIAAHPVPVGVASAVEPKVVTYLPGLGISKSCDD